MPRTPGDGRKFPLGTGLLNIAGEKIEDSGILGHSLFMKKPAPFQGAAFAGVLEREQVFYRMGAGPDQRKGMEMGGKPA